jgi:hypothetical protein
MRRGHLGLLPCYLLGLLSGYHPIADGNPPTRAGNQGPNPHGFDNCLKPVGIVRNCWQRGKISQSPTVRENHLGLCRGSPVVDLSGPAILDPDLILSTPKGLRRLEISEWLKIKGLPPDLPPISRGELKDLVQMPGVQEWCAVGDRLMELSATQQPAFQDAATPKNPEDHKSPSVAPTTGNPTSTEIPDLSEGSVFFKARLASLKHAVAELEGPEE